MDARKRMTAIVAIITAIVMLLTGTFAWIDFSQHSTNVFTSEAIAEVRLNDLYNPPPNWASATNAEVNKQVSVTNINNSNMSVYVRLQFKEFLAAYNLKYPQLTDDGTPNGKMLLFATHAQEGDYKGHYVTASSAEAEGLDMLGLGYVAYPVEYPDDSFISYYLTDNSILENGIYGKSMNDPLEDPVIENRQVLGVNQVKADYSDPNRPHELHSATNPECNYDVHTWSEYGLTATASDATYKIHEYIEWELGVGVRTMTQWLAAPELGNFWILDADGWVYWANPLDPGQSTSNIMESVTLLNLPGQGFEYYIHIDMEAATIDELDLFRTDTMKGTQITTNIDLINALQNGLP